MKHSKDLTLPFGGVPTKSQSQPHGCKAAGAAFFKAVAKAVGLSKEQFDIRYNACGDWGETTFHTDSVYMHANFDVSYNSALGLLGRTCAGRKDYMGGPNQWLPVQAATLANAIALYRKLA